MKVEELWTPRPSLPLLTAFSGCLSLGASRPPRARGTDGSGWSSGKSSKYQARVLALEVVRHPLEMQLLQLQTLVKASRYYLMLVVAKTRQVVLCTRC